jgi:hypothetical protein
MTAEENYRLLQEIEANRKLILMVYQQNPALLAQAEPRIRQLFGLSDAGESKAESESKILNDRD